MDENKNEKVQILDDEHDKLLNHEYDGIRELDNYMPNWWVIGFFITILFSQVYLLYYHVTDWGPSSADEYTEEVQAAASLKLAREKAAAKLAASQPQFPWDTTVLTDGAELEAGKAIYNSICNACHGQAGQGLVGPNLTDDFWIHGCSMDVLMKGIQTGYPQAGMPMYGGGRPLNNKELQQVASYILSLRGTNPPNQKPADPNREKPCTP
jgi:cytochrome c oxidase cbb3-type subunit 3